MRRSRSPFHPGGSRKLTRSDLSERPLQVAPEAQSDLARVTPRGRSHFYRMTTTQWSQSDLSQRHSEVTPEAWSDYSERRAEVARIFITRERENESGATSRSDTARSLPKCGATTRSDERSSILDHPRSNPYAHEFSFPLVKKVSFCYCFLVLVVVKNSSKSLVALRLSEYLHSQCFDIPQNWFDNHYTTTFVLGALKTPNINSKHTHRGTSLLMPPS
ncbi:hypothetical protein YC2023_040685 [Brassica napus]